jgi:hypothetical protein
MTERIVQRRQGKKRNIARIFDAMYGLNAVYPEVQASTPAFATLIIFLLADYIRRAHSPGRNPPAHQARGASHQVAAR